MSQENAKNIDVGPGEAFQNIATNMEANLNKGFSDIHMLVERIAGSKIEGKDKELLLSKLVALTNVQADAVTKLVLTAMRAHLKEEGQFSDNYTKGLVGDVALKLAQLLDKFDENK